MRVAPLETLEWADSFTNKTVRLKLMKTVFWNWSNVDPDGAVREVLRLRDAEVRDNAAHDIVSSLVSQSREYPRYLDLAEQLFDAIRSADVRRDVAKALYRHYATTVPDPHEAGRYAAFMTDGRG